MKTSVGNLFVLLVASWSVIAASSNAAQKDSSAFTQQYNGNIYPIPNYTLNGSLSGTPTSNGDILTFRSPASGGYWQSNNWSGTRTTGFTVEFRIKVGTDSTEASKGAFALYFGDGGAGDVLSIGKNSMWVGVGAVNVNTASNSDAFHTFRIAEGGSGPTPIQFWRDDVLIHTWPNGGNFAGNALFFGSGGSSFGGPTVQLDYIRWDNTGAFSPVVLGDFNDDGFVTAADIDLLRTAIVSNSTNSKYDVDHSGSVNSADFTYQIQTILGSFYGDANLDKSVDAADLALVRKNFGNSLGWASGNFSLNDTVIDASDLATVRTNFGMHSQLLAVPEPSAICLAIVGGISSVIYLRANCATRRNSLRA